MNRTTNYAETEAAMIELSPGNLAVTDHSNAVVLLLLYMLLVVDASFGAIVTFCECIYIAQLRSFYTVFKHLG